MIKDENSNFDSWLFSYKNNSFMDMLLLKATFPNHRKAVFVIPTDTYKNLKLLHA